MNWLKNTLVALGAAIVLASCGEQSLRPPSGPAEKMIAQEDWSGALAYYRERLATDPEDAELLRGYYAVVEAVVNHHVDEARRLIGLNDISQAEAKLGQGLFFVPDSTLLKSEMGRIRDLRRSRALYRDGAASARLGRGNQAIARLEEALALDPDYTDALKLLERLYDAQTQSRGIQPIRLRTNAPVTLTFREAGFKEAMLALGQAYGVNMIFDAGVENRPISLFAENVTFVQAFELLLKSNRTFYRRLGRNSVVIAPDTAEARAQYEDYVVRTIYLDSGSASEMADLISRSLGVQTITANESSNSVTMRDSREKVALAEQLVQANDRRPAEVVMEVEILEVNRTKSEQLGLDFGSQATVTPPSTLTVADFNSLSDIRDATNVSALSLPAATLRFFKQDVDAKTLASPRIRTLDKREALIHIGDRVPLRSSTIQDATGQTRTTFEYRDVGIKLTVTPEVKLNRSVVVDLVLEVSSLGQNLGTADEPAFAIGTRNVSTNMVLDDTETAIIGGLIRDEDRRTVQRVPGLGSIPRAGRLFRSNDGQGTRTDILLTLTPRIIRGRDVPGPAEAEFFSGSGTRVTSQPEMDFLVSRSSTLPTIRLDLSGTASATDGVAAPVALPVPATPGAERNGGAQAALSFSRAAYEVAADGTLDVVVSGSGFAENTNGTLVIRFRPDLVEASGIRTLGGMQSRIDNTRGEIEIDLDGNVAGAGTLDIATINFRALKTGLSYLIFSNNFGAGPNVEVPDDVELRASRIIIR